ncbi:10189_t:CDS:2 [Dentiscutata erythropus]|uniref:10189_t:CDS:1 n=1 Tax=Dentiscutata erythropus TaxID=1348616 RepID=A0A9N9HFP7_9GLOM|nr:10189_t:CDS:2 [Dentiscutata erythropus]
MGLPMYVSPSLPKRQLPPKQPQQPQSPPYTPYEDTDLAGEPYLNSRTSAFGNRRYFLHRNVSSSSLPYNSEYSVYGGGVNGAGSYRSSELSPTDQQPIIEIPELLQPRNSVSQQPPHSNNQPRTHRIRSISYNNLVQQHIQRLHHLQHLHRTREQQLASSNLATRPLAAAAQNLFPTNDDQQESQDEFIDLNFEDVPSHSVFRRVNLLRQLVQQQDNRVMRPTSRHHRSSSSHGRTSNTRILSSPSSTQSRDDLLQRGIDVPTLIRVSSTHVPPPTFSHIPNHSLPPVPRRLPAWHSIRRSTNFSNEPRSLVDDEFYPADIPLSAFEYDSESSIENGHTSRILSPIPRRYDPRLTTVFSTTSHNTLVGESGDRIDVDSGTNSSRREIITHEQRSSASGEVC